MDKLPTDLVRQNTLELVENYLKTSNFSTQITEASPPGENYIGILYRGKFREDGKRDGDNAKQLNMIIKLAPQDQFRRMQGFVEPAFHQEIFAYNEVLPAFMKFQENKGIKPTDNGFHEIAECLKTIEDEGNETIFLKDLSVDGFEMYSRLDYVTPDHVNMIMKILGKFHAISFAMRDQCPENFAKFKAIKDPFRSRGVDIGFKFYVDMLKGAALKILHPVNHKKYLEKFNEAFKPNKSFFDMLLEVTDGQAAEPYSVVIHGDCWNNNFLYRYEDGKLNAARLIDWQMMRYASPIYDLMYYIFLGTSKEIRDKHYVGFLDTYYEAFSSFLKRLGSSPEKLFSRKAFDEQLKKYGRAGLVLGCMMMPLLTRPIDEPMDTKAVEAALADPSKLAGIMLSEKQMVAYAERLSGIISDIIELGYI